ncbi:MAG: hypothetical protein M3P95_08545, partial [Actinomycetota bacterium]|nr:hypothetical protein [Actinomycetota bacterium]
ANLRGAVGVCRRGRLRAAQNAGAEVVLVDDVCASGATLAECAQALGRAGVPPRAAAVAAATVLRSAPAHRGTAGAPSVRVVPARHPDPVRRPPCPADADQD